MAAIPPSGRVLPGAFVAGFLHVIVDMLGRNGTDAVLRRAGLTAWIGQAPGEAPVDYADLSALLGALEETLGARGGRGLERRMGAAAFDSFVRPMGAVTAMRDPAFQAFPLERRMRAGLYGLSRILESAIGGGVGVGEAGVSLRFTACPVCWGRSATEPICASLAGLLGAAGRWIAPEADLHVVEGACRARGDAACEFSLAWEGT